MCVRRGGPTDDFENCRVVLGTDGVFDGAGVIAAVSGRYRIDLQNGREAQSGGGDARHGRVLTSVEGPAELGR